MKKTIMIVLIGAVLSSCSYQLWFKPKYFTYLYDGKDTGIDSIIEVVGYYQSDVFIPEGDSALVINKRFLDSYKPSVKLYLIYKNGTIMETGSRAEKNKTEDMIDKNTPKTSRAMHLSYQWGRYKLVNDTIKAQFIIDVGPMSKPVVVDTWFLIKSNKMLEIIYSKNLTQDMFTVDLGMRFHFHPYPNRIDSTWNPHLKRKWFWDKDAYKMKLN